MSLNPKEEAALNLIEEDDAISTYFFAKASDVKFFIPLKERGHFSPERAPGAQPAREEGYFYFPEWKVTTYLKKIAEQVKIPGNEIYTEELLSIIREVSRYSTNIKKLDNFRIWASFIGILVSIPNKYIPIEILDLLPSWLDSKFDASVPSAEICTKLLPKFFYEQADEEDIYKGETILKHLTHIETITVSEDKKKLYGREVEFKFRADSYWLEKALEDTSLIAKRCSIKLLLDIEGKIRGMLKDVADGAYYSFYTKSSIHEPLDLLTIFLRDVLNDKAKLMTAEIEGLLDRYIRHDYLIFQKLALYIYGNNTLQYKEQIWGNIRAIIGDSFSRNCFVGDELKNLLQNLSDLDDRRIQTLITIIEAGPHKDIPEEERELYISLWKQRICRALNHFSEFRELYNKLKLITSEDTELGPAVSILGASWGLDKSPLKREDFLETSNKELAAFLATYSSDNYWEGPTVDGLSDVIKDITKDNPEKVVDDLFPFSDAGFLYIYDILWGLRDAWKERRRFSWTKVFSFVEQYIKRDDFWSDKLLVKGSHWHADHNWILRIFGDLIQEGIKDDSWAFDEELVPDVDRILRYALSNILKTSTDSASKEDHDPVTHALNSAPGTLITALFLLALKKIRMEKKKGELDQDWLSEYVLFYEQLFDGIEEAFTLFGQYLPNFAYLDEKWTNKQITIMENEKEDLWMNFIIGYLYGGTVYFGLFKLMKKNYERAIAGDINERLAEERLAQHIVLGYLNDLVTMDRKDLLGRLIDRNKPIYIDALVGYLRGQSESPNYAKNDDKAKLENKAIAVWSYVYNKYKDKEDYSSVDIEILSNLLMLMIFLPRIDSEYFQWIKLSLSFKEYRYHDRFLYDDLIRISNMDKSLEVGRYIGKIMGEIVNKNIPTLFKDKIRLLVQYLYDLKDSEAKAEADKICGYYFRASVFDDNGQIFLRDVYERYR